MGYIKAGKDEGATVHTGGDRFGSEGYFINPTIFTDTTPDMKIVKEEIFGPVGVVIKFEDEDGMYSRKPWIFCPVPHIVFHLDVIRQANDTSEDLILTPKTRRKTHSFYSIWSGGCRVQSEH